MTSSFKDNASRYLSAGYSVIPILPGAKRPGYNLNGQPQGLGRWAEFCKKQASDDVLLKWKAKNAGAGIGIALGYNNIVGIDLDYGTGDVLDAIESIIPDSPAVKRGAKGYTAFFRTETQWPSRIFNIPKVPEELDANGKPKEESVCEVLSLGRQSVLPPTVHPETNKPYTWDDHALCELDPLQLPLLPESFSDDMAEILKGFGYKAPTIRPTIIADTGEVDFWNITGEDKAEMQANMNRRLNNAALANIEAWVEDLGSIAKPHGDSWRVQAHWRGAENHNVSVYPSGIRDFGNDQSMTPIDLVMAAKGFSFDDAYSHLAKILDQKPIDEKFNDARMFMEFGSDGPYKRAVDLVGRTLDNAERNDLANAAFNWTGGGDPVWLDVTDNDIRSALGMEVMSEVEVVKERCLAEKNLQDLRYKVRNHSFNEIIKGSSGLLAEMIEVITSRQRIVSRELAFGAAISTLSHVFGRRWASSGLENPEQLTFSNIYCLAAAPSGSGKTTSAGAAFSLYDKAIEKCFEDNKEIISSSISGYAVQHYDTTLRPRDETGAIDLTTDMPQDFDRGIYEVDVVKKLFRYGINKGNVYSYGGLHGALMRQPNTLLFVDEFDSFIKKIFPSRQGGNSDDLAAFLKNALTATGGSIGAENKANNDNSKMEIMNPCLTLFGVGTGAAVFKAIPNIAYKDGTMGRFLVIEQSRLGPRRKVSKPIAEGPVVTALSKIIKHKIESGNLNFGGQAISEMACEIINVPRTPDADIMLTALFDDLYKEQLSANAGNRLDAELLGRTAELAQRIALIHALGRNWDRPIIDVQDLNLGIQLADYSLGLSVEKGLKMGVSDSDEVVTSNADKVLSLLASSEGGLISRDVYRHFGWVSGTAKAALTHLHDLGKIKTGTNSKGKVVFIVA